ncbi:MAG: pilin [Clostridia bacterium]|nr:pilin [Clostridia bacterium]
MFGLNFLANITSGDALKIVDPVVQTIRNIIPAALGVVGAFTLIYCIILGVKYAKADDPQEHEKAKKGLKNAIIGFVLIFVLMLSANIALPLLSDLTTTQILG